MSFLIADVLLLALAISTSAQGKIGSKEGLNTPSDGPRLLSQNLTCTFFSNRAADFKTVRCTDKDIDSNGSCNKTQICKADSHCFTSWSNSSGVVKVHKSGCWLSNSDCDSSGLVCRATNGSRATGVHFCCCLGSNCNTRFYLDPAPQKDVPVELDDQVEDSPPGWHLLLYILLPLCLAVALVLLAYWCYRKRKAAQDGLDVIRMETPATCSTSCTAAPSIPVSNETPASPQLLDVKARGRFGKVWRAQLHDKIVAVKTFDLSEKASWQNEQDIFRTPLMNRHDNILKFLMAHNRGSGLNQELWLITEFYERGSLADFLKVNTVTFKEGLNIIRTMGSGMSFLHEDVQDGNKYKPSIAHRDFKSKNVLLDQNLNAIIADFGLAVKFLPGESPGESHGQVGTLRYMAPEVLEGAINFQKDAFLRIDMYAFGLVMWEISTRVSLTSGAPEEFRMPFEAELSTNPSMDCMQEFVVEQKKRPLINDEWKRDKIFATLCDTIEECWDHDAEARLSAGCVELRIVAMQRQMGLNAREPAQVIVNTSPVQNGLTDTEVMNQRNLQNNKNVSQNMNGFRTSSFNESRDSQAQRNKVEGDTYIVFTDDDRDSGTFASEDTLSHDGVMEQLVGNRDQEQAPDVVVSPGDISSDTSLLTISERASDV